MNSYMKAQITNMIAITQTFEQTCDFAAMEDDGKKSLLEKMQLKKIKTASQKFRKELESVK